jgi:sugar lactone lactonase YvrE
VDALAHGYGLVEGPRWDARDGSVWFTDALRGGVFRVTASGEVETMLPERPGVGGLVLHAEGGAVASGRDLVHIREPDEAWRLAAVDGVAGFNDLHADGSGRVLAGGLRYRPVKGEDPVPGGVWRVGPGGAAEELFGGVVWPNGIGLSPDGATVYVSDYERACVLAWSDGGGEPRLAAQVPEGASCDGLAIDVEGGLWVALGQGGGIGRFSPDGTLDAVVDVPAAFVSSVSFGGKDGRDLFVSTMLSRRDGTLYHGRADVAGLVAPLARV